MQIKTTCQSCRFFRPDNQDLKKGTCCVAPPVLITYNGAMAFARPTTNANDPGCKEFSFREPVTGGN